MAKGTTHITNESIIERGYDNIIKKLTNIWVNIQHIQTEE
jgi:UDP-N-acetylglucosamine enolpyruvyl transferase